MHIGWIFATLAQLPGGVTTEEAKLTASDAAAFDGFGYSVALTHDTALVGAGDADGMGLDSGAAYVYVRTGGAWSQQAKLIPADLAGGDFYGHSVALEGNTALVGSPLDDDLGPESGSAYFFVRSGASWVESAKLTAGDGAAGDYFGHAVALRGETAVISAMRDDDNGAESGSVYIFVRSGSGWTEQTKLKSADGKPGDLFGTSVALYADTVLVGAQLDDEPGADTGAAFVFERSGTVWTQTAKLTMAAPHPNDYFGHSVALFQDTALIGAPLDADKGASAGAAYVFTRAGSSWTQTTKLHASDGVPIDRFGHAVALDLGLALVGAPPAGGNQGKAYLFDQATWNELDVMTAVSGHAGDLFGRGVALHGLRALIGAPSDGQKAAGAGAAYVFRVPSEPVVYCTAKTALVCGPPAIGWVGAPSAAATSGFVVSAAPARSNKTGLLLYTPSGRANIPFPAGGHILCVALAGIRRAGPTHSGGTPGPASCDGVLAIDMNAFAHGLWVPPGGQAANVPAAFLLTPGQQVNCQYWGRDSTSTGSLLSAGIEYLIGS